MKAATGCWLIRLLLEADTLVPSLDCRAGADLAVAFAQDGGYVSDLPAAFLAPFQPAAEMLEGLDEEALHMAGLEPLRLRAFHFEAKFLDPGLWHGVVGQRAALEKLQEMRPGRSRRRPVGRAWP